MKFDVHKTIETAFSVTKIVAIIIAGAWTYYQWDKVLFPKESAEQDARQANLRTDLKMSFEAVQVQGLGQPFKQGTSSEAGDYSSIADESFIVEVSGLISIENSKPFPIELAVKSVTLEVRTDIQFDEKAPLQAVAYSQSESIDLAGDYVFGDIIFGGFVVESGGVARLAFRAPVVLKGSLIMQPHEYVFGATFDLSAIGNLGNNPDDGKSKTKRVLSSVLVNGPIEAGLGADTHSETNTLARAATRIDLEKVRSGSIFGGSNSIFRKPLGNPW